MYKLIWNLLVKTNMVVISLLSDANRENRQLYKIWDTVNTPKEEPSSVVNVPTITKYSLFCVILTRFSFQQSHNSAYIEFFRHLTYLMIFWFSHKGSLDLRSYFYTFEIFEIAGETLSPVNLYLLAYTLEDQNFI